MEHQKNTQKEEISRKEALKKIGEYGKYAALTAIGTYTLLNPKKAQAQSPTDPGTGFWWIIKTLEIIEGFLLKLNHLFFYKKVFYLERILTNKIENKKIVWFKNLHPLFQFLKI